jgi:hypothetical protein
MQPHTPVALGFTTGLEVLCGGAAHAQPGAQTPASAVLAPCAAPAQFADEAVLLSFLVAVHDGRRHPAHALAHRPFRLLVAVHDGRRRPAHALARPHRHPAPARPSPAELSSQCPRSHAPSSLSCIFTCTCGLRPRLRIPLMRLT